MAQRRRETSRSAGDCCHRRHYCGRRGNRDQVVAVNASVQTVTALMRQPAAALGTAMEGRPYVSLVLSALDANGAPLLLLSDLAQHSRNIAADPRVSMLFDGTAGLDDPLTGARVTLIGTVLRIDDDEAARDLYVKAHPSAAGYAGFGDFHLYRVSVERAHLVAGFGRIEWIEAADLAG